MCLGVFKAFHAKLKKDTTVWETFLTHSPLLKNDIPLKWNWAKILIKILLDTLKAIGNRDYNTALVSLEETDSANIIPPFPTWDKNGNDEKLV